MLLRSTKEYVKNFDIQPLCGAELGDVARFLHQLDSYRGHGSSSPGTLPEDLPSTRQRLEWLLTENPLAGASARHGLCVRDAAGALMGLLLAFPGAFLAGEQRLLGLGSGSFFVEPRARALGFYLFRRYLSSPGYSFFFSTTCNANSAPLWEAVGARAVPKSDMEYILPLKLEVMLPAFLSRRTSNAFAARAARVFGRAANPVLHLLARKPVDLIVEPCRDWGKLAELFRRQRDRASITTDRSTAYLAWRYGPGAHNGPFDICVFRDQAGHEGWFVLGNVLRGRQKRIRGCVLLDATWPRSHMSFRDILPAIIQVAETKADAIFIQPRPHLDDDECSRWIIPCRLEAPKILAVTPRDGAPVPLSALDLVPADGDGAL